MPYLWRFKKFPEGVLDPRQLRILVFLRNNGPHTSGDIARTLGYSVQFTRRALQILRKMGAVEVYLKPTRSLEDYGE
ncbi:MAG: transcriptional regulator [Thaumarchaeota archaeon]|nr:transcriptional regulator [Nitrososphaerota archaeon]MCL7393461.1 transcriptional regulator [Candidatus Wolframiiraptor allenii]